MSHRLAPLPFRVLDALTTARVELKAPKPQPLRGDAQKFGDVLRYQFERERATQPGIGFALFTRAADTIAQKLNQTDLYGKAGQLK